MPPPPPEDSGSYPEDREHEDEAPIDSALSIDEVVAWIADGTPGVMMDSSDDKDDEGVDGFGHNLNHDHHPVRAKLEPFDTRFATSSWTRWDGTPQ